jgi:CRP-like cAMP-binding protein
MEDSEKKIKCKVLIVDDDSDFLEMLSDILTAEGFKVTTAGDGVDGSFKYSNETFDLIMTDIRMPKKDGIKLVQLIQTDQAQKKMRLGASYKPLPIILISASLDDFRVEIELLGNIEVLNKPFSPKDVLDKVNRLLEKKTVTPSSGVVSFKAGSVVIREGDESSDLYFVKEGTLKIVRKAKNGADVTVSTVGAGEMVGEMGFLLHKVRTASVLASTDCILINIQKEKLEAVIANQPKWFKVLLETVTTRLEDTTRLLAEEKSKK